MGEVNKGGDVDEADEDDGDEETRLIDNNNPLDESIPIVSGFNQDVDASTSNTLPNLRQNVVGMKHTEAGLKRSYVHKLKKILENEFGIKLNKGKPGSSSTDLFNNMKLESNGVSYKGVKVIEQDENGKMKISEASTNAATINEFKELLEKAKIEYSKSSSGQIVEIAKETQGIDPPSEMVDAVRRNSLERIGEDIETQTDFISKDTTITFDELREFRGEINIPRTKEKLKDLEETERVYWKELYETEIAAERKARAAGHEEKAKQHHQKALLYDAIVDVIDLKADQIRLELDQRPKWERVINIIKEEIGNSELTKI